MKLSEKQLLTQNVQTSRHLLEQLEHASRVNASQYAQLKTYMSHNLPSVFAKVVGKIIHDVRQEKELASARAKQLWIESCGKDQEIADLRNQLQQLKTKLKSDATV